MITISKKITIARKITSLTANAKDWRIRNKYNRAMREVARDLTAGKGYIIASARDLSVRYGDLFHHEATAADADKKYIWAVCLPTCANGKILFSAI